TDRGDSLQFWPARWGRVETKHALESERSGRTTATVSPGICHGGVDDDGVVSAYEISRPTGYAVWHRSSREGAAGLEDRSRAPQRHPNQTPAAIAEQVLELRRAHMRWGGRKLKAYLEWKQPEENWPAASTIGEMLQREGLVVGRKTRRKVPPYTQPFAAAQEPNQLWCADFKGWFRTGDGERIDPLTATDACSRYLLRCQAVEKTDTERVQAIFEAAFREYGMPAAIRTDN